MAKDYEGVGDLTGPPVKVPSKRGLTNQEAKGRVGSGKKEAEEEAAEGLGDVTGPIESMGKSPKAPAKKMARGGVVRSSASKRADGCAQRGKTRGRMV